ncbi:S-adenosylmethionine synthetase [Planctopirus ephydatiae]|uniref:S-adenosylmethionine synthetase n=1 Tax=Planctopirus ephydatiae TaxID=2528019 RepID=A0A518GNT4_9PLAN|nr:methionine adenosyltransferase [Planctopirus ephydatiae]QDV30292.1 S-adenosylmethionine synthetase [Planctopirus ephydatiae]
MSNNFIVLEDLNRLPLAQQGIELVERKGKGHPDSLCDAIAEEVSLALCREYSAAFGRILHYNADKAMLVAGRSEPKLGGGRIVEPMRLVLGDRASSRCNGKQIDVVAIAEAAVRDRLRQNLRFVDADQHVVFQNELKEGSPELTDIFERDVVGANDTSAAVGYAPLTETERLVLEAERWVNSPAIQRRFPEAGEDVKVMGVRQCRHLNLTVAIAFVDRFIADAQTYFDRKEEMRLALTEHLLGCLQTLDDVSVQLNTLDDPARGEGGMYLTVLGTSAEGGDCGQVGRGNRVNGVIPLNRPISNEAAAGKNPVSHVGKIYSLLTHYIANEVVQRVEGVAEVYIWLCSQIGKPIQEPMIAASQVILRNGVGLTDVERAVKTIIEQELAGIHDFSRRIVRGEFSVW